MKLHIVISCFLTVVYLQAQVGVNTQNPRGVFHIDPKNNTSGIGLQDSDDVIVTATGNVGIGTIDPQTKLDVRGTLTLKDGTQAPNYILQTDNNGVTSWVEKPPLNSASGTIASGITIGFASVNLTSTGGELKLTKGQWIVCIKIVGYGRPGNGSTTTDYYNKNSVRLSLRGQRDSYVGDIASAAYLPEQFKDSGVQNMLCAQLTCIVDVSLATESFRVYALCNEAGTTITNNTVLSGSQFMAAQLK